MERNPRVKFRLMIGLVLAILPWATCYAVDGQLVVEMAKEMTKSCKTESMKVNPKASRKATEAYCNCFGREVASGVNDADLGSFLQGKESPHFTKLTEEAETLCRGRYYEIGGSETRKNAKYEDLPDISLEGITRTKSGVFAPAQTESASVMMDSDTVYMLRTGNLFCGWSSSSLANQSTRSTINDLRSSGPTMAKTILKTPDALMANFEETKIRNNPAVFMEFSGVMKTAAGDRRDMVMLMAISLEVSKNANVVGFCMTESSHYDNSRKAMSTLVTAATSSRTYRN